MNLEENYKKNSEAIQRALPSIYARLERLEENIKYDIIIKTDEPVNILDIERNVLLHNNSSAYFKEKAASFYPLREHPFLYFFGMGNGLLIKRLLENPKHTVIVFEPEIEILFIALHGEDFSMQIATRSLTIFHPDDINFANFVQYLNQNAKIYYARSYTLHFASKYYETYYIDNITKLNTLIVRAMEFIITNSGNDIHDALMGLEHHVYNLPRMIAGMQFREFIKQKHSDTVVMVSTGPSLTKQLSRLKSIQNHATIISADSALRILYEHDISPDICVSLERIDYVAELFRDLPTEYKKKTIFVRASLQHKSVFETLEGCDDILVMRPHKYNLVFNLEPYGVLCSGTSVANMAHELSAFMKFKTCIIIGQDLAYGEDGITHSKGHILGEKDESITQEQKIEVPAYGGQGTVLTNKTWELFLNGLIQTVDASASVMTTINATEGGARIDGTIEMPFSDAIDRYINRSQQKERIRISPTPHDEAKAFYKIAEDAINALVKEGEKLQKEFEKAFLTVAEFTKKIEHKTPEEQLQLFSDKEIMHTLNIISSVRGVFEENYYFKNFYWEIMQSIVVHNELELANIKIMPVNTPLENKEKAIRWIFRHFHYLFTVAGSMHTVIETIRKAHHASMEELPETFRFLTD
jgi:hypothetical protein